MKTAYRLICLALICITILSALSSCAGNDPNGGKLMLAKDAKALYTIVVAKDASEVERHAAEELKAYLDKITGADFPLVTDDAEISETELCVGKTNREKENSFDRGALGEDGFIIRNAGEKFYLAGGGDRGTLYCVYSFLEEYFGVRYLTENYEIVPKAETLALEPFAEDNRQIPLFDQRRESLHNSDSRYWNEKQKLNVAVGSQILPTTKGHSFVIGDAHSFGPLLGQGRVYYKQPCLTDEKVYQTMLESARKYLDENPDADIMNISQNDASYQTSGECECDSCKDAREKYGSTGVLLNFVNRLVEELQDDYPNVTFETLAYYHTASLPKGGVKPAENLAIRFCNLPKCLLHSWAGEDPDSPQLYASISNDNYTHLKEWADFTDLLYVWDYGSDFGCSFAIMPNLDTIYENIHTAYELGVKGYFMQGMHDSGEFTELRAYLCAKMMWKPDMSLDEFHRHATEFMEGYYGVDAAPYIQEYFDYAAQIIPQSSHPSIYWDSIRYLPISTKTDENGKTVLDTAIIDHMNELFDKAEKAAQTTEEFDHIKKSRAPLLYYEILAHLSTRDKTGEDIEVAHHLNQRLYQIIRKYNITRLREGYGIPENPNLYNAPFYWNKGFEGVYNDTQLKALEAAAKKS